jgi:hypothetical protein
MRKVRVQVGLGIIDETAVRKAREDRGLDDSRPLPDLSLFRLSRGSGRTVGPYRCSGFGTGKRHGFSPWQDAATNADRISDWRVASKPQAVEVISS